MTTPHRTLREAAQMALDALTNCLSEHGHRCNRCDSEIDEGGKLSTALREALAAPEPLTSDQEKALSAEAKTGPFQHTTPSYGNDMQSGETPRLSGNRHAGSTPPAAPAPAAPVPDGWVMVPREPTPEMRKAAADAWIDCDSKLILNKAAAAIRAAIAASPAAPAAPVVPLTDEQIWSMWMSSEFRGNGGQADWFCEGIRAAEAHHGITGGKP